MATMNCMSATSGHVQNRKAPAAAIPRKNNVKMPVDGEMYAKATANELNVPRPRFSSCL